MRNARSFTVEASFDALTDAPAFLLSTESTRVGFTELVRSGWGSAFVPAERLDMVLWIREITPTELR